CFNGLKSSKKVRKLTKAQKAKLQQEEEERRLREEEEAQLQAEREEQERLERERKEKEVERLELKVRPCLTLCVQWDRYMRCDGAPDPAVRQDINTFISLWRDDPEVNITAVCCSLQLVEELEVLLRDATDPQENQTYQEAVTNLQELIHSKHNLTTEEILKIAGANIDTETGNMQTVIRDDKVTLCLWANMKKNPRFEVGLGFEIPKQLAVSDVAVRILHTHHDHLSMLARMTHLRTHTASREEALDDLPEQVETKENGEVEEDSDAQQQEAEEEVRSIRGLEGRKVRLKFQVWMNQAVQVVDLMQFTPLGGVFYYDVFLLPPQAHQVNGWEIRQLLDTGLQMFHYPTEKSDLGSTDALSCPPVGASVTLPHCVVFLGTPQVARWDAAGKQWRMDGITDVSYEEAEAKISFKMDSFQAFVLMQETYINLPFQSWELRPLGQDSAIFTMLSAIICLFGSQDNQCMLQSEPDRGLSHFTGKWMSVSELQKAMISAGVNVFVNEYTDKYVSTCGKDPLTEHAAYEQMALFASACAFSWSKWNSKCGAEHLVMQVCEHLDSAPVPEGCWSLYLLGAQRNQKLEITEESEAFSPDHHPGSEFNSTFIHMLQDSMSPDGIARTRTSHHLFVDAVQSLLCATRPLMYSQ
uniref:Dynein axonemal intermediate chain 7 n=1 Tax=Stegastes partitus TaxID=144197 RepID=A0A3B5AHD9_9TELE